MEIKTILFDVNGTLIDISTDDHMPDIFRKIRNFLQYNGIYVHKEELHDLYFLLMKEQKKQSPEKYSEFDAVEIWRKIIEMKQTHITRSLEFEYSQVLPKVLAHMYRAASFTRRLQLYPGVKEVLHTLKTTYPLGIVTNAQSAWGIPELRTLAIAHYFDPIIVSGDYGYCKPDTRLFHKALEKLKIEPHHAVFVGNDMFHDVVGAKEAGMRVVFFHSNQGDQTIHNGISPDYIIKNFPELINAIEHIKAS